MRDVTIGRLLVASLHQGIADVLPMRLTFYEEWLNAEGLRVGTIGAAAVFAVLSFLRQEGEAYEAITARAGQYAAEWMVQTMPPFQQRLINAAPLWLRTRLVVRLGARLVHETCHTSSVVSRVRRLTARIDVRESVFCAVREPVAKPLCRFYVSAFERLLSLFRLDAEAAVVACRGTGGASCVLTLALSTNGSGETEARVA
jgi:bacteriochlorophyll 4-vinyl reductase